MTIALPTLDDLTFDDLVQQAVASIPKLYPEWTNYNPSDPGITLIELFAWLSEMMIYRTGRIPDASYQSFIGLLNGPVGPSYAGVPLDVAIRQTLDDLRAPYRAVTVQDYVDLVTGNWTTPGLRVECIAGLDVNGSPPSPATGYVSVIVAEPPADASDPWAPTDPALLASIASFLDPRRMITTSVAVAGPTYVPVTITATLYLQDSAVLDGGSTVASAATQALIDYFDPWTGAPAWPAAPDTPGPGWPFGRWVHVSEVCAVLAQIPGVDHVGVGGDEDRIKLAVPGEPDRAVLDTADPPGSTPGDGGLVAIRLEPYELPRVDSSSPAGISLVLMQQAGGKWQPINP